MNPLERAFHQAMVEICRRSVNEVGYNPTAFKGMLAREGGGPQAARDLLASETPSDGFTRLWEANRLDLTMEAVLATHPEYNPLFDPGEIERARQRLADYGYHA
jgi:hypothetical protein